MPERASDSQSPASAPVWVGSALGRFFVSGSVIQRLSTHRLGQLKPHGSPLRLRTAARVAKRSGAHSHGAFRAVRRVYEGASRAPAPSAAEFCGAAWRASLEIVVEVLLDVVVVVVEVIVEVVVEVIVGVVVGFVFEVVVGVVVVVVVV